MSLPSLDELALMIERCMACDHRRLRGSVRAIRQSLRQRRPVQRAIAKLRQAIDESIRRVESRRRQLPEPAFPDDLPISACRHDIARAIEGHQVVIVCGDTGSGKSTQLPKICLGMGRGVTRTIGHTQPRRIAARGVAARVAEELGVTLGGVVGCKVRFSDSTGPDTLVKVMTDGILLAETQGDRLLEQYDTLILDEAHERSLNIDFLLGYLRQILPRRPDLRVIVTSATIDPGRFSRFFEDAPVIEVSGRMYPVEVRYRPLESQDLDGQEEDMIQVVSDTVEQIVRQRGGGEGGLGDVLVFLPGEREIRDASQALIARRLRGLEVLPLYARLSVEHQMKVFAPHEGTRVVLATNVAETSLTVPGVRYVIDSGLARMSRYNPRSKVQRLPIEPISRASADQRKGRCGRVGPGVCIRLYSEIDYESRGLFTPAEILRTNLASVILQMKFLELGEPEQFPFIDPPGQRMLQDGYQTLIELEALDAKGSLTAIGRQLARLPVDPRLGRMILAARQERCLREVLIIAAALAAQDPRDRPMDQQDAADHAHARFADPESDFMSYLKLWDAFHQQARSLTVSKLRRWCQANFLSFVRMREWHDIHRELLRLLPTVDIEPGEINRAPARYDPIHRALLSGLLSNVGVRHESGEYIGPRGGRFRVFPGSGLFRSTAKWIMAGDLVETSRLYARTVAAIRPAWIERLAQHQVMRDYLKPYWDDRSAKVYGYEKVMFHGLLVQPGRKVLFGPIDPAAARDIFIAEGLVEGRYQTDAPFFRHNRELVSEIKQWSVRLRKAMLVDDSRRFTFYHERIPAQVHSGQAFEVWRRRAEQRQPRLLFMARQDLMHDPTIEFPPRHFPDVFETQGMRLPLEYRWDPADPADGVTAIVPLAAISQLRPEPFEWMTPGLLAEKVEAMIRSLPKTLRTNFVPVPHYVNACVTEMTAGSASLAVTLAATLSRLSGLDVQPGMFVPAAIPQHLAMNFRVVDQQGREIASGRHLPTLQNDLAKRARAHLVELAGRRYQRDGLTRWDFGDVPREIELACGPCTFHAFPAIVDHGQTVSLQLAVSQDEARRWNRLGVRRLFMLELRNDCAALLKGRPELNQALLHHAPLGPRETLIDDLVTAAVDQVFMQQQPGGPEVHTHMEFEVRLRAGWPRVAPVLDQLVELAGQVLRLRHEISLILDTPQPPAWDATMADIRLQLQHLLPAGFLTRTPVEWRPHLPRYVRAIQVRLRKAQAGGLSRDQQSLRELTPHWQRWLAREPLVRTLGDDDAAAVEYRWMLEEMRVSLFAQELRTISAVSLPRLDRLWQQIRPM